MSDNRSLTPRGQNFPEPASMPALHVLDMPGKDFDSLSYLHTYWNILNKHRWVILTITVIVTLLAAISAVKTTPIYEATVHLDIEADTPQIQSLNDLFHDEMYSDEEFIGTQIQVLEGDLLAERTLEQLGLAKNRAWVAALLHEKSLPPTDLPASPDDLLAAFHGDLRVQSVRDSHVVNVSFESADPVLSAKVANALGDNYIEYSFRQKYDATRQAAGWMEKQLDELKAKVESSQQALVNYERQNAIVNINDKQSVVEQGLADLSRDLTAAQSDRLQKESLNEMVQSNESQVAFVAQNELLQRLEEKSADLKSQYADALAQYGPKHPKAERLQSQVDEIQSLIERERKRTVAKIRNDYTTALEHERLLTAAVAKAKVEVGRLDQLLIQHNILKREFDTNQQLYDNLQQRLKDASVSAGLRATNIHVIDPARPPNSPVLPQIPRNIMMGLMGGLVLGIAVSFLHEVMDTSIKSIDEAERCAQAPALAVVPDGRFAVRRWALPSRGRNGGPAGHQLPVLNKPMSPLAESFRALVTSLVLSSADPPQVLLVTSSTANEGKTMTALNLAVALAQQGYPTLLVDADLRHPTVAAPLGLVNGLGLTSVLTGAHRLEESLRSYPRVPGLWVLAAGQRPPNPTLLLSSPMMATTLGELRKRFKAVVIDSPPVLPVTDAIILSPLVDGIVFVVESGVTVRGAVMRARKMLQNAGANVLGIVLNKVDVRFEGYYGYYNHYSYQYHADSREKKGKA